MDAVFLQRSDQALGHAVLLWAMWRNELLAQPITADQGRMFQADKNQPIVRLQKKLARYTLPKVPNL
tara:strand:+ start:227 stop:427 length:201 start_codon:yes stop_codon:yes gene_type:complete